MQLHTKYSEDEVLIFAGKFVDQWMHQFRHLGLHGVLNHREKLVDVVEGELIKWNQYAAVPLPPELVDNMSKAAKNCLLEIFGGEKDEKAESLT